jgi:hypothetical protein
MLPIVWQSASDDELRRNREALTGEVARLAERSFAAQRDDRID